MMLLELGRIQLVIVISSQFLIGFIRLENVIDDDEQLVGDRDNRALFAQAPHLTMIGGKSGCANGCWAWREQCRGRAADAPRADPVAGAPGERLVGDAGRKARLAPQGFSQGRAR